MAQSLPVVPVEDLRARLDADPALYPDAMLQEYLDIAGVLVGNELDPDGDYILAANVAEAIAQLAVKVWDLRPKGVVDLDMAGDVGTAMPATRGLVLSVRGLLLPSMPTGGVTV